MTINAGDTIDADFMLPELPDGETWSRGSIEMRFISNVAKPTTYSMNGVVEGDKLRFSVARADTRNLRDGVWRYQVLGVGADGTYRTIEKGVVDIVDPLDPRTSHNERMVLILREVIENKMTDRGDVIRYTIGDREVQAMTLDELRKELSQYEERYSRERKPRQYW